MIAASTLGQKRMCWLQHEDLSPASLTFLAPSFCPVSLLTPETTPLGGTILEPSKFCSRNRVLESTDYEIPCFSCASPYIYIIYTLHREHFKRSVNEIVWKRILSLLLPPAGEDWYCRWPDCFTPSPRFSVRTSRWGPCLWPDLFCVWPLGV